MSSKFGSDKPPVMRSSVSWFPFQIVVKMRRHVFRIGIETDHLGFAPPRVDKAQQRILIDLLASDQRVQPSSTIAFKTAMVEIIC